FFQSVFGRSGGLGGTLFEDFFGGGTVGRRRGPAPGRDARVDLEVALEDVARGGRKEVTVQYPMTCPACRGTGAEGERLVTCRTASSFGCPAVASRGTQALRPVTSTSPSMSDPTIGSYGTGTTSSSSCPSPSRMPRSAPRSRCPRWRARPAFGFLRGSRPTPR